MKTPNRFHAEIDGFDLCDLCIKPNPYEMTRPVETTEQALYWLEHFRAKQQEYLICLSLDSTHRLIARRIVTIGLLDSIQAHPREILADPLKDRAASVIIAHNHPSGSHVPSKKDMKLTQQIASAGQLLGVPLADHYILTPTLHFSFRQHHLL